jgi:GTP-binding protein
VLVHVIDAATLEPGRDPLSDLEAIEAELSAYVVDDALGGRPLTERTRLVAINKIDVPDGRELAELVRPDLEARGLKVLLVSAATHEGLRELGFAMAQMVAQARADLPDLESPRVVLRPRAVDEKGFTVAREETPDGVFYRISGGRPVRWVRQTDFANDEAVGYLADRLARAGVEDELVKAGARAGDTVLIGTGDEAVLFDWEPTLSAGAELLAGPRGGDLRLDDAARPTRDDKRQQFADRRAGRRQVQEELAAERKAGHWATAADPDEAADEAAGEGTGEDQVVGEDQA